ncbi:TPA: hypothetical protein JD771_000244 [Legionella pneumophila subsp. pneumophila]|nr:hypothetical protein [Legionella pneumophila subsp. pneumophila]
MKKINFLLYLLTMLAISFVTLGHETTKTAENAAYSDENEHPFWANVNTCYFNALSQ